MPINPLEAIQARLDAATGPLCSNAAQPGRWPGMAGGCQDCDSRIAKTLEFLDQLSRPFIVCPTCGNKRCPKAQWHGNECTHSNLPGQPATSPNEELSEHATTDITKLIAAIREVEAAHQNEHRDQRGRKSDTPTERGGFCYGCGWYIGDACPLISKIRRALT